MIKRLFVRLAYGAAFALPLMILTYALAQAGSPAQQDPPPDEMCSACHGSFTTSWEQSAHGQAGSNPAFIAAMEAEESTGSCLSCHTTGYDPESGDYHSDAITCTACHDTSNANHPMQPMSADRSAKLCGTCHQETLFEWQVSAHRESGLSCIGCHDPHETGLKKDDPLGQCATCHRSRASNFAHSEHSKQGLTCSGCHLAELDGPGDGHARLDHSFNVRLSTCNSCHAYQMHDPSEVHPEGATPPAPPDALAAVEHLSVVAEPLPVNPVGFATLSGLFGLAAGVILAPWLERRYRGNGRKDE